MIVLIEDGEATMPVLMEAKALVQSGAYTCVTVRKYITVTKTVTIEFKRTLDMKVEEIWRFHDSEVFIAKATELQAAT